MAINLSFTLILLYILINISIEDLETMIISENKLKLLTTLGFTYLICLSISNETINIIDLLMKNTFSMLIIFVITYSISYVSYKITGINSLGIGDIKLYSISSIWLGIKFSFISLCISFFLSAIYSLYGKIFRKFRLFHQYPFAPFVSIGIFSSWIIDKI